VIEREIGHLRKLMDSVCRGRKLPLIFIKFVKMVVEDTDGKNVLVTICGRPDLFALQTTTEQPLTLALQAKKRITQEAIKNFAV